MYYWYSTIQFAPHRVVEELASGELGQIDKGCHVRVASAEQKQIDADLKLAELHRFVLYSCVGGEMSEIERERQSGKEVKTTAT